MFNNCESLKEKDIIMLQDLAKKLQEYIQLVSKSDEMYSEISLAMAAQFFIYSLVNSNDRFTSVDLETMEEQLKVFIHAVNSAVIDIKEK